MSTVEAPGILPDELAEALRTADPRVRLVPARILRRVIRGVHGAGGFGRQAPHRGGFATPSLVALQFATREMTQAGAGPPQIVRCKFPDLRFRRELFDDAPDHLLSDTLAPHGTSFAHAAENPAFLNVRGRGPALNRFLDPSWYWDGSDVTPLAVQIDDDPPVVTLLDV